MYLSNIHTGTSVFVSDVGGNVKNGHLNFSDNLWRPQYSYISFEILD